ncbi:hypothetical protein FJZ28_03455 [Candidatus Peregrinibacteria bacterium]|nr:hypothetical protein [Candidatus Peregrinibacteria bacterium]
MARRKTISRFPLGEHVETLQFWPGKRIISTPQNEAIHQQMTTIHALRDLLWHVDTGVVQIRDVPISISGNVRKALDGLSILNGTASLTEKS